MHLMRTNRRHRLTIRPRAAVRSVLVAMLALWVGLIPCLPGFHLAFSRHAHHYCPQHHQIEDCPIADCQRDFPPSASPIGGSSYVADGASAESFKHDACTLANGTCDHWATKAARETPELRLELWGRGASAELAAHHQAIHSGSLILIAPKTSPPFPTV